MKNLFVFYIFFSLSLFGAERVISLAPAITEIIYAIKAEDNLLGVTTACNYPKEATKLEKVGDFGFPLMEKIIMLKPTLILGMDLNEKKMEKFNEIGIIYYNFNMKDYKSILETILKIGKLLKKELEAENLCNSMNLRISKIQENLKNTKKKKPKVFVVIWHSPLITAGKKSFISDIINMAGGINIADNINEDYPVYNKENLVYESPDFIIAENNVDISGLNINSKIIRDINPDILFRPGPRICDAVEELCSRIF